MVNTFRVFPRMVDSYKSAPVASKVEQEPSGPGGSPRLRRRHAPTAPWMVPSSDQGGQGAQSDEASAASCRSDP